MNTYCEHCGASLKKFWHRLTPGLVRTLIKFRKAVHENNKNCLHLYHDLVGENELTTAEQMNWTKLRFHGLVAKAQEEKHWLLTRRGAQFLNGEIAIPKRVQTFRNRVVAHDPEQVFVKDVIGESPYFEQDFEFDVATEEDMKLIPIEKGRGRRKWKQCPRAGCGAMMMGHLDSEPVPGTNSLKVRKYWTCTNPNCDYKYEAV